MNTKSITTSDGLALHIFLRFLLSLSADLARH